MCYWENCKLPFVQSVFVYDEPLELIEIDLWGHAPVFSNGNVYYMSIVDIAITYTWIYFCLKRVVLPKSLLNFIPMLRDNLGIYLKLFKLIVGVSSNL